MNELHLFRFGYTWPEELARIEEHPEFDLGEASEAVFVRATSAARAQALGQEFAEAFVHACFGNNAYSWHRLQFASWIEHDLEVIAWAHKNGVAVLESVDAVPTVATVMAGRSSVRPPPN